MSSQCPVNSSVEVWLKWYTDGTVKSVAFFASMYAVFTIITLVMTSASMMLVLLDAAFSEAIVNCALA